MREILFRGKRIDNKEWVQGYYVETLRYNNLHWILDGKEYVKIDPETIGQYTGLTDKNGKKIFEGDIVKTHSGLLGEIVFGTFFDDECECDVCGWFWIVKVQDKRTYCLALSDYWGGHEIIGNIHDNPELVGLG